MHYATLFLSALAATGSLAAPGKNRRQVSTQVQDTSIRVQLSNQAIELGSGTNFEEAQLPQSKPPVGSSGPFDTVLLTLGSDVENQALRCKILDSQGKAIVVVRGANVDITFADAPGGEWTFRDGAAEVRSIICDDAFVKGVAPPPATNQKTVITNADLDVVVQLSDGNLARQQQFDQAGLVREVKPSPDDESLFNTVSLRLGADVVNQELRCQLLAASDKAITLLRNGNSDTTFAKGEAWTFEDPEESQVSTIVCDPAFKKRAAV